MGSISSWAYFYTSSITLLESKSAKNGERFLYVFVPLKDSLLDEVLNASNFFSLLITSIKSVKPITSGSSLFLVSAEKLISSFVT